MEDIGSRIKALRKGEALTQKDFSKRLLISQSYLSGIENGNEVPTDKLQKLICLEFGVNEMWLSNNVGEMYDDVYENDKALLVEESNRALLTIMSLLATKSNVEYGMYSFALGVFADMLSEGKKFNSEDDKLFYLELIDNHIMNLEHMTSKFSPDPHSIYNKGNNTPTDNLTFLNKHADMVTDDVYKISALLAKLNNWSE